MPCIVRATVQREIPLKCSWLFTTVESLLFFLITEYNLSRILYHTLEESWTRHTFTSTLGTGAAGKTKNLDFGALGHKLKLLLVRLFFVRYAIGLYIAWVRREINVSHLIFLLSTSCLEHRACPTYFFSPFRNSSSITSLVNYLLS